MVNEINDHKLKGFEDIEDQLDQDVEWVEPDVSVEAIRPKFWKLRAPSAASAMGWEDWTNNAKSAFPIRYWIQHDVAMWFSIKWTRITDAVWWIRYRTTRRNHVFKFDSLKPGYYDTDILILHSVFDLFDRFMKFQHSERSIVDWTSDYHLKEWTEMNEIWEWWKQRDAREENFEKEHPLPTLPDEWGVLSVCNDRYRKDPQMLAWKEVSKRHTDQEIIWEQEDEDMLIRVMKIRRRLWD